MNLRAAAPADAAAIAGIYAPYVTGSLVSFETEPPDAAEMRARIKAGGDRFPWLVAEDEAGAVYGYAYSAAFRTRPAYRFAVETSLYVAPASHGRGVGSALYQARIATLEAQLYVQAIAAITLPNPASVRLHERLGFTRAGTYTGVGWKLGGWHDVGLWQRPLAPAASPPAEPLPFAIISASAPG